VIGVTVLLLLESVCLSVMLVVLQPVSAEGVTCWGKGQRQGLKASEKL